MKIIEYIVILFMLMFLTSPVCFGQNRANMVINNIKKNEVTRKEGLKWFDSNNIMRANFCENYKNEKLSSSNDIALEYLKLKHKELGLDKELKGLELVSSLKSDNRENFYFIQSYNDIPIFGTEIITTLDSSNTVVYLLNNCVNMENILSIRSDIIIGKQEAIEIGLKNLEYANKDVEYKISKTYVEFENNELILCWILQFENWTFIISAQDGAIYKKGNSVLATDIQTKVYAVNPLYTAGVAYGTTGYVDNNDQTTAQLNAELTDVTLNDVSLCTVLGKQGYSNEFCYVINIAAPNIEYNLFYHNYPIKDTATWYNEMDREDDMFEVAMVLYHIDKAGKWVTSLGYLPPKVYIDPHAGLDGDPYADGAWTYLSSFGASNDKIRFGVGGVDNAEDQFVIWHEYAHHINYSLHPTQNYFFDHISDLPTASLMEGFADYFAGSYKKTVNGWDSYAVGEWGAAEYYITNPTKRRRTDTDKIYPADYGSDGHLNGQIFSSALMDVENEIGRFKTNKILLSSIAQWGNSPSLPSAGENFINAAEYLYGKDYLCQCVSKFKLRGLTQRPYTQIQKVIHDETIQSSITYNDACIFNFENVVIENSPNVNVVVEPISGETTIVRSFEVKLGSTFEVK
jgi:Zn-dependent metalloprotease